MLAVDRLGLPTDALRGPFLQQLSGSCDSLKMGDLRRVLMALARCWQASSVHPELLDELCGSIVAKWEELPAWQCDPRNLLAVPQHLGRLRHPHPELLNCSAGAISALISSRLSVLPADALRSFDGLLLLAPLVGSTSRSSRWRASRPSANCTPRRCCAARAPRTSGAPAASCWPRACPSGASGRCGRPRPWREEAARARPTRGRGAALAGQAVGRRGPGPPRGAGALAPQPGPRRERPRRGRELRLWAEGPCGLTAPPRRQAPTAPAARWRRRQR
ncbi:unnamed protein product [Prorocentrum cordatum]|uniref:Anaphase-promoting complex subunit 1 n=1 Tax=Prorocentrum cordatum TaxID=2364126 RepID=A0ABN9U1G8_9DINO|nr:unnamed protein product [Polarella glacialis]